MNEQKARTQPLMNDDVWRAFAEAFAQRWEEQQSAAERTDREHA